MLINLKCFPSLFFVTRYILSCLFWANPTLVGIQSQTLLHCRTGTQNQWKYIDSKKVHVLGGLFCWKLLLMLLHSDVENILWKPPSHDKAFECSRSFFLMLTPPSTCAKLLLDSGGHGVLLSRVGLVWAFPSVSQVTVLVRDGLPRVPGTNETTSQFSEVSGTGGAVNIKH